MKVVASFHQEAQKVVSRLLAGGQAPSSKSLLDAHYVVVASLLVYRKQATYNFSLF